MADPSESKEFPLDNPELISSRQRRLWTLFQQTATSLTHIYKCKSKCQISTEDQEAWLAFQSAASALTSLYRESADILSSLEKQQTSNATSSVTSKEDSSAANESYVNHSVSKLKRSWHSDWPDPDDFGGASGGGGGKRRRFL